MYNDKDSDMIHLFGDNHDDTLPIVFKHISRTAGELDPSDLTSAGPKVPWLRTVSKARTNIKNASSKDQEKAKGFLNYLP